MKSATWRRVLASVVVSSAVVMSLPVEAAEAWVPPNNPDPNAILREAKGDTRAGRYEVALAKHVWYHNHALEYQPSQYRVRLSFALSYWMDLAEQYPPALEKLKALRDEAGEKTVTALRNTSRDAFHDFVAINRELDEPQRVRKLFLQLHEKDPDKAARVFKLAEPVLVQAEEYKLCGEYLDPDDQVPQMIDGFQRLQKNTAQIDESHKRFIERKMTNDAATMVALLILNDGQDEAEQAAGKFKQMWNDQGFHKAIDTALTGKVPKPWP